MPTAVKSVRFTGEIAFGDEIHFVDEICPADRLWMGRPAVPFICLSPLACGSEICPLDR